MLPNRPRRMLLSGQLVPGLLLLAVCWQSTLPSESRGDEPSEQKREFTILVDDKPCGRYALIIRREADESEVIRREADVRIRILGLTVYRYSSRNSETWKRGRLHSLENTADYNGEQFMVKAETESGQLRVRVNGREQKAHPDVWTTSYWKLPEPQRRLQPLGLLECDKGQDLKAKLQLVGDETIRIAEREEKCTRYQITGGVAGDLWYDSQDRLVRQEMIESGHSTKFHLTSISE